MTDTIKIYRGIDFNGVDSLFAVMPNGLIAPAPYEGANELWLSDAHNYDDFFDYGFVRTKLKILCRNPVLVHVVTRDKDAEQPKDYAEQPDDHCKPLVSPFEGLVPDAIGHIDQSDDHCKPLGKYDHLLLGAGLFLFGVIVGIILAVEMMG